MQHAQERLAVPRAADMTDASAGFPGEAVTA
jgi:hypothetical protein